VTKPRLTLDDLREALSDAELEHARAVDRLEQARRNPFMPKLDLQAWVREATEAMWEVHRATKKIVHHVQSERNEKR
jgi:hypothetical protein